MSDTRTIVGIAQMSVAKGPDLEIVTHALGSCIGLTIFDPVTNVGGMVHYMLPAPNGNERAAADAISLGPHAFGSSAVPALFRAAYAAGADKSRIVACAAGGAEMLGPTASKIGQRNWTMLRKLLWKNGVALAATDVGGSHSRNMSLSLAEGAVRISTGGSEDVLWQPGDTT